MCGIHDHIGCVVDGRYRVWSTIDCGWYWTPLGTFHDIRGPFDKRDDAIADIPRNG